MRHLSVAASLTQFCTVCRGERSIPGVSLFGIPVGVRFECPHCVGVAGQQVEIPELTYRTEYPRGTA